MKFNPWISHPRGVTNGRLRLYCFPYAGRGGSVFVPWCAPLAPEIEVCPILLPGREARIRETSVTSMPALVDSLVDAIQADDDLPFAFFGHSLGGLVAFELSRA